MITKSYNIHYKRTNKKGDIYTNIHAPTIDKALEIFRKKAKENGEEIFEILHIKLDGINPISENDIEIFGEPEE